MPGAMSKWREEGGLGCAVSVISVIVAAAIATILRRMVEFLPNRKSGDEQEGERSLDRSVSMFDNAVKKPCRNVPERAGVSWIACPRRCPGARGRLGLSMS